MEKQEAKEVLMEQGRYSFNVEYAREICKAFGVELDESLIRTTLGHRENIEDPSRPRVDCCSLSAFICKSLGKKRDEKKYELSCKLSGEGSWRDVQSEAYATNL